MEIRVLRYFITVVQEGNITRAAERLKITQPTLSRQLIDLEKELHTHLFIRNKRKTTLTSEGEILYERAKKIVELAEKTLQDFYPENENTEGTLSVGISDLAVGSLLEGWMHSFSEQYPKIQWDFYFGNSQDILDKIDTEEIDVGFVHPFEENKKYATILLPRKLRWGLFMKPEDPLASKVKITAKDLAHLPLILPKDFFLQKEMETRKLIVLEETVVQATYNFLVDFLMLAQINKGYIVAPERINGNYRGEAICFRPFSPEWTSDVMLVWKGGNVTSGKLRAFLQHITFNKDMKNDL